jgi:hypothetical protein
MLKYLRKYNKILLVGFGVFIMISFLVPQAMQQAGRGGGSQTVMVVDGRKISYEESIRTNRESDAVLQLTGGIIHGNLGIGARGDGWLLAREEARRGGFIGGPSEGRAVLAELPPVLAGLRFEQQFGPQWQQLVQQIPQLREQFQQASTRIGSEVEQLHARLEGSLSGRRGDIDEALATARGMVRMGSAYRSAARLSAPRLISEARRLFDEAEVQVLFVDVNNKLSTDLPAREEATVREQFDRYKAVRPGEGEFGFGYLQPPRVKLEWLKIDRAAIERATKADPVEVQKRLLAGGEVKAEELSAKRREIEEQIKREQTDRKLNDVVLAVKAELLKSLSRLNDEGGYKVLPEDWAKTMPRLGDVVIRVNALLADRKQPVPDGTLMAVSRDRQFMPLTELNTISDLSRAELRRGSLRVRAGELILQTRELKDTTYAGVKVNVQTGVPIVEALEDQTGSRYFMTVLEAMPESAPSNLDEVREMVVQDRKRLDAFASLRDQSAAWRIAAAETGLDTLAETMRTSLGAPVSVQSNVRVSRAGGVSAGNAPFATKELVEAVAERMSSLDATVALDQVPAIDRTLTVLLPKKLGLAIVRFTGFTPVTQERFQRAAPTLMRELAVQALGTNPDNPFTTERLERRLNVEHRGRGASPEDKAKDDKAKGETTPAQGESKPNQG